MKKETNSFEGLAHAIVDINDIFLKKAKHQVNVACTLRNWIIGYHIFEYEQSGADRAEYGEQVLKKLSERIKLMGVKGLSFSNLYVFKKFYKSYPQIIDLASEYLQLPQKQLDRIFQTVSGKFSDIPLTPSKELVTKLSFSHFVELIKCEIPLKQVFYETECINNSWTVRSLQRAMSSLLFERTGFSKDKKVVIEDINNKTDLIPENIFRNPYVLDFLNVEENSSHNEIALEQAIINQLHKFLIELGRGFCFEARQKRITFDNDHYRIDLVFYHRILKRHVLIHLKLKNFTPADAGQMNMFLNYYKDNEMQEGDNPPIGIILCAGKSETLVKYSTEGMSENLLVSKFLTNLPTVKQLTEIIQEEQAKRE